MRGIYLSHGTLYDYQLMPFFNIASRCGFDGVEIIVGRNRELSDISFMKHLSKKFEIPVKVLHCPFNSWQNDFWPKKPHEKLMRTVEMASELGAEVVVAHTALSHEEEYKDWLVNGLPGYQAKCCGIKIGIENMPRRFVMFGGLGRAFYGLKNIRFKYRRTITYDMALNSEKHRLLMPVEVDRIERSLNSIEKLNGFKYVTIDTTHLGTWGCDPAQYLDDVKSEVAHVHLSNYKPGREHRLPTDGVIDLAGFLKKLSMRRYGGGITIETDPNSFERHRSFSETSRQLKENIEFIKNAMSQSN